jgi:ATP-dependent Lon protease
MKDLNSISETEDAPGKTDESVLPVIPLKELVVFPFCLTPIIVSRPKSLAALNEALEGQRCVFLVAQKDTTVELPRPSELYTVGTVSEIVQVLRIPDGSVRLWVEGRYQAEVVEYMRNENFVAAALTRVDIDAKSSKRLAAFMRAALKQFEIYYRLSDRVPEDLYNTIRGIENPVHLINAIVNYSYLKTADKQAILEMTNLEQRYARSLALMQHENELLQLENKILNQVKSQIGKTQKEYYLNEQLKVIEKELGLASEEDLELDGLERRVKRSKMSKEARDKALKEITRLAKMTPLSPEANVSRTYVEWLVELPSGKYTKDKLDLEQAQRVLDEDHYGLEKPKERIIEYLAVNQLVKKLKGPILCFVGPPGVGKTSLARSIARTLGRKFVRASLGGVRDEAEIRGHRRTYVGALPGKIIQLMKKAGAMNPVFLLDEVDKMSIDFRGDPSAALLEVLDPEQNKAFNDHYLEVDFDLSKVLFITTANTTAGIPPALLDRMEVIRLPGYTEEEKVEIARQFLAPKQIKAHGLTPRRVEVTTKAIRTIISGYTREAGVRNLEREIASICRKVAKEMVRRSKKRPVRAVGLVKINPAQLRHYLGPMRYKDPELAREPEIGVATGLAWTEVGGELLPAETTIMKGKGNLVLTGKLGEVMQESAKTALSYIRSRTQRYHISDNFYRNTDIHVHIPEGAIAKDGPSAGVTMATSMVSALSNLPVRQDIAMTGEITLRGKVLKIGGLKEKVLAAHRAHIRTVIIPQENKDELEELSKDVRREMRFILVNDLDEVLNVALEQKSQGS